LEINMANTFVENAVKAIRDKNTLYTTLYSYKEGNPPLRFSTERLDRAFGRSFVYFAQSFGSVIISAILDRLVLKGFNSTDNTANNLLDELFSKLNINLEAQDIHESLQVTGEAFVIVDIVDGEPEIYFNDPRLVEVFYDPDRPKVKLYAAKKWTGLDNKVYMNLYFPDRTEKYVSDTGYSPKSYNLIEEVPNTFGIIPVFHFRNSRRKIQGEFDAGTVSIIDAINKLFGDLMVAAEFEAFKMRVFISKADPGDVEIGPDMKMWLPANEESVGQDSTIIELGGSSLQNFLDPINNLITNLAITTRTPRTLFMNSGSNLSGEALIVEESGLVKKVEAKQEAYAVTWQELAAYLLRILNYVVEPSEINCVWAKPYTALPLTDSIVLQNNVNAGIPLLTALKWQGKDEQELDQITTANVETGATPDERLQQL